MSSKTHRPLRLIIALAALAAAAAVTTPAAYAIPDRCMKMAWTYCDPKYPRLTQEWQTCFGNYYDACKLTDPQEPTGLKLFTKP